MTQYRVEHNKNYTVINNTIVKDNRLSWKAKGIWLYAFSRPDNWTFYKADIIKQSKDSDTSVDSGLKELENCGYLIRIRKRDEKGRVGDSEWTFFETPKTPEELEKMGFTTKSEPKPDFPDQVNPEQENNPLPSTDSLRSTKEQQTTPVVVVPLDQEKRDMLRGFEISENVVTELIAYDIERIQNAIESLRKAQLKKVIPSPSGFLVSAIREGYKPSKTKEDIAKEIQTEEQQKADKIIGIRAVAGRLQQLHQHSFTEDYSFSVTSNIQLKVGKRFAIIDFSDDNCLKILAQYIEKKGKI